MRSSSKLGASRLGLTLLELLVVLVILAIVATVAVSSLQPQIESTRFNETQRMLQNVREATIGKRQSRQADGTPLVSGFVSDVGRLPRAISATSPLIGSQFGRDREEPPESAGRELRELWSERSQLANEYPFRYRAGPKRPDDYSDVQLPCGWRGPYLHLPLGRDKLLDAWGRPFLLESGANAQVETLIWEPVGSFERPMRCDLRGGLVTVTGTIDFGETGGADAEVVLLRPNPDVSLTELAVQEDEHEANDVFLFSGVPVGLRAICVTVGGRRVLTKYVQVPHSGLTLTVDLSNESNQMDNDSSEQNEDSSNAGGA